MSEAAAMGEASAGDASRELGRLRWRCRRGMKELDLLLTRYVEHRYVLASAREQAAFRELLETPDPDLNAYVLGRSSPPSADMTALVVQLLGLRTESGI